MLDFYELLKAAKIGLLPPDATYFDKAKVQAMRRNMERKRQEWQQDERTETNSAHPSEDVGKRDTLISNDGE